MSKEEMIEEIKKMTVVELADLVKAIEEEFGVSAVAAAAPAAGGAAGAAAAEEIITLAKLPSRDDLLSMLAGALLGTITKFAVAIDQVRIQKEAAE